MARTAYCGAATASLAEACDDRALCARVRGFNKFGNGEWSSCARFALPEISAEARVEVSEIPAAWVDIDVCGLPELREETQEAAELQRSKEALLQSLHRNRQTIQVA